MKQEIENRINDLKSKIHDMKDGPKRFEMQRKLMRLSSIYEDMYFDIE